MTPTLPDLASFVKDYAFMLTAIGGLIGMAIRWALSRYTALDTKLVQTAKEHAEALHQMKLEQREWKREMEQRHREVMADLTRRLEGRERRVEELEDENRAITRTLAEVTKIPADKFEPRRPPRRTGHEGED